MIDTDKYAELTIDDWHNLKAHQWEEVMHSYCNIVRVNESLRFELDGKHEDGLKWIEKCEELDAEVKRLRELLYKCWKDSGQSLHYLQVELLNDQEYWYEQMICDDDSKRCGDYGIEDCECDEE